MAKKKVESFINFINEIYFYLTLKATLVLKRTISTTLECNVFCELSNRKLLDNTVLHPQNVSIYPKKYIYQTEYDNDKLIIITLT